MIYFEMALAGSVHVYEMTERLFILRAAIEAKSAALEIPTTPQEAHEYRRSTCYALEIFPDLEDAEAWAESYQGFRAEEVRAALARFLARRAKFSATLAA